MAGGHDHDPLRFPVQNEAQIQLPRDVGGLLDPQAMDLLARSPRLLGDQRPAQQGGRIIPHLRLGMAELDPAHLAPATGMDLCLHDDGESAQFAGAIGRLFRGIGQPALRYRYAKAGQDFLGLMLVNVHGCLLLETVVRGGGASPALRGPW